MKRLLAELAPADGALVLNDEDPVSRDWDEAQRGPGRPLSARRAAHGRHRRGWMAGSCADVVEPLDRRDNVPGPDGRILPLRRDPAAGLAQRLATSLAAVAVGALFGSVRRAPSGPAVAGFGGVEHRLEPVATVDGVRYVNDSQGTQPDAVIAALRSFPQPLVLICGGRSKGVAIDDAGRRWWRSGPLPRCSSARAARSWAPRSGGRPRPHGAPPDRWTRRSASRTDFARSARDASGADAGAGDGAAQPGRRQLRHVSRLHGARPRLQAMPSRASSPPEQRRARPPMTRRHSAPIERRSSPISRRARLGAAPRTAPLHDGRGDRSEPRASGGPATPAPPRDRPTAARTQAPAMRPSPRAHRARAAARRVAKVKGPVARAPRGGSLAHHRDGRARRDGRPDDLLHGRGSLSGSTSDIIPKAIVPRAHLGGPGHRHDAGRCRAWTIAGCD